MLNFSVTKQFDYHWQPLSQARMDSIPNNLKFWLRETGSLTALLERLGILSIEVINDGILVCFVIKASSHHTKIDALL